MPGLQCMDDGAEHQGQPTAPGVCEPTQVHYTRKHRAGWPFKFYEANGRVYQNTIPRQPPQAVEDALW